MLGLLWAHNDSPVEGVSEHVMSCLTSILKATHRHNTVLAKTLTESLLQTLLKMSWSMKGKLRILTVLLPWIDSVQVGCGRLTQTPHRFRLSADPGTLVSEC